MQGEVLLSICTLQTALIVSQLVPSALFLQHTLLRRHQQCLAYAKIFCDFAEMVDRVDKKGAKAIESVANWTGLITSEQRRSS